jgi:hypothetical protein
VRLVFEGNKETYTPVKTVSAEDNIAYMSGLYSRCQETRERTRQELADKYLKPLARPAPARKVPGKRAGGGKAAAAE